MTTVSNASNNLLNSTSSKASSAGISSASSDTTHPENTTGSADSVSVSSRAQNLQKLSEEFFSDGLIQLEDMPKLVERLEEYGFISSEEAQALGLENSGSENELEGELGELQTLIDQLTEQFEKEGDHENLISAISNAKTVIESFDQSASPITQTELNVTIAEITNYLENDASTDLTISQQQQLDQLNTVLKISDKLQQSQLSTDSINQYLTYL